MEADTAKPTPAGLRLFLSAALLYYGVYAYFFTHRVSDYFTDALRHFEFLRRFFGES